MHADDLGHGGIIEIIENPHGHAGMVPLVPGQIVEQTGGNEQIQVQVEFPQHQKWVKQFRDWWREGMSMWRERNGKDATLIYLCELGPPPYAITDAHGLELSDRWNEALVIRGWVEQIWEQLNGD